MTMSWMGGADGLLMGGGSWMVPDVALVVKLSTTELRSIPQSARGMLATVFRKDVAFVLGL